MLLEVLPINSNSVQVVNTSKYAYEYTFFTAKEQSVKLGELNGASLF